jgi:Spy/CpxP family protein refolding chaperone
MRKIFVLSGLVLGILALVVGVSAQAAGPKTGGQGKDKGQVSGQGGPKPGQRGGGMMGGQRILDQLNLTAAQKQKVEALQTKMRETMKSMMQSNPKGDDKAAREKNMAKFKSIREQYEKDLMAILTKDQQAKYKALIEEMRNKRGAGGPPGQRKKDGQ